MVQHCQQPLATTPYKAAVGGHPIFCRSVLALCPKRSNMVISPLSSPCTGAYVLLHRPAGRLVARWRLRRSPCDSPSGIEEQSVLLAARCIQALRLARLVRTDGCCNGRGLPSDSSEFKNRSDRCSRASRRRSFSVWPVIGEPLLLLLLPQRRCVSFTVRPRAPSVSRGSFLLSPPPFFNSLPAAFQRSNAASNALEW